jgi:hypothetical protein
VQRTYQVKMFDKQCNPHECMRCNDDEDTSLNTTYGYKDGIVTLDPYILGKHPYELSRDGVFRGFRPEAI